MSHHGSEQSADVLQEDLHRACFAILGGDGAAMLQRIQKIPLNVLDGMRAIKANATFKVHIQTSEIQIDRADAGKLTVADHAFCMNEAVGIFIELDTCRQQLAVVGSSGKMHHALVGMVG